MQVNRCSVDHRLIAVLEACTATAESRSGPEVSRETSQNPYRPQDRARHREKRLQLWDRATSAGLQAV